MKTVKNLTTTVVLAAGLSVLGLGVAEYAQADSTVACTSLSPVAADQRVEAAVNSLAVVKTENLYRWQQRPWARFPQGVAFYVKAPAGTTAADLHNLIQACAKQGDSTSPMCATDADIRVTRAGGLYVLSLTSASHRAAADLQRRAENVVVASR